MTDSLDRCEGAIVTAVQCAIKALEANGSLVGDVHWTGLRWKINTDHTEVTFTMFAKANP